MLTIYRRHRTKCPRRDEATIRVHLENDIFFRKGEGKCSCPLWVDGLFDGKEIRQSLRTRDWDNALKLTRKRVSPDSGTVPEPAADPLTIQRAEEKFLAVAKSRQLAECTIYKYRLLFKQIGGFAHRRGLRFLNELNLENLDEFRSEWKDGPRSSQKKLERLRAFLRFCERRKWIDENPATYLKGPKIHPRPTLPFTRPEMIKILAAFDKYGKRAGVANAQRLKAFVLLIRYSGMRIGDTVKCGVDRIADNKLFLYTQKTDVPVHCVLPAFVARELEAAPKSSDRYFFWTGKSKAKW